METSEIQIIPQTAMLEAINRSEVDVQITTAKTYPRDLKEVLKKIEEYATIDKETAESCFYSIKRGEDIIEGISVRFAEIIATCYGNLRVAARVIGNDGRFVTCQGVCHDLESNLAASVEVKRRITTKNGQTFSEDMQTITANAGCAIAFRNAVMKVVPKAVTNNIEKRVKEVAMQGIADKQGDDLAKIVGQCIDYFGQNGVSEKQVLGYLGVNSREEITAEMIYSLRTLNNAINEGSTTFAEAFQITTAEPVKETSAAKQRAQASMNKSK